MITKLDNVPISQFAKVIGGYAFKSGDFEERGIPVIKIKNIGDKKLSLTDTDFLPEDFLSINDKYKVQFGDVLISLTGSHITQPNSAVGRVARSREKQVLFLNQRVGKMSVYHDKCDLNFLYYFMISDAFRDQIGLRARGAANQANVSGADVEGINIPNFSLDIQKKITAILSAYDDLIENNLKRIRFLEEIAQITYEEWFVRMKFPGHEVVEIDSQTGLPIGWKSQTLRRLTSYINRGVAPKYVEEDGFPVINQRCIRGHRVNFAESRQTASEHKVPKDKLLQPLDILVNSTGTGTLGRVAQLFDYPNMATVDTHVTIVRPSDQVSAYWLGRSLEAIEPFIVNLGKGATNQQELGRNDLADIVTLNTPTEELMKQFDDFAHPIFEAITNLLNQNDLLKEARDVLLPRLMTGMIDIDKVELPEALLERINK